MFRRAWLDWGEFQDQQYVTLSPLLKILKYKSDLYYIPSDVAKVTDC